MSRFLHSIQKSTPCSMLPRQEPCKLLRRPRRQVEICFTSRVTALTRMETLTFLSWGEVDVMGLTLNEAHSAVDAKVSELFSNYHLQVKLGGVRFSALGEFNRPGKHVVMQNQVTIFEAIALGGDLGLWPIEEEIRLIRQHPTARKSTASICWMRVWWAAHTTSFSPMMFCTLSPASAFLGHWRHRCPIA